LAYLKNEKILSAIYFATVSKYTDMLFVFSGEYAAFAVGQTFLVDVSRSAVMI